MINLIKGDCLEEMAKLPDQSIDAERLEREFMEGTKSFWACMEEYGRLK